MYDIEKIKNLNLSDVVASHGVDIKQNGVEFSGCCPFHKEKTPSFTVNDHKGFYYCFGCGANGDAIDFVMEFTGVDFKQAAENLGAGKIEQANFKPKQAIEKVDYYAKYTPEPFTHSEITNPLRVINPKRDHKKSSLRYEQAYRYGSDGYVLRMVIDGKKITPTVRWCGDDGWIIYPFDDSGRQLYRLEHLKPKGQVFIGEGEKVADYLAATVESISAISWSGGTNAVLKTDWSPLAGRAVVLFPDNDAGGFKAMRQISEILDSMGCDIKIAVPEIDRAKGWDVADSGFNKQDLIQWAKNNIGPMPEPVPAPEPANVVPINSDVYIEPVQGTEITASDMAQVGFIDWPDQTGKGKPKSTLCNMKTLLDALNITVQYNLISKEIEILVPGSSYTVDNARNSSIAEIRSLSAKYDFPQGNVQEYVAYLADQNPYNPVMHWIDGQEWDGVCRFDALVDSLDSTNRKLTYKLLRRWMISAVAAVYDPNGVSAAGMLVLQGKQYIGKGRWFRALTNDNREWGKESAILNPSDKDSVKQCISYWLVELGELDATFRKSDIAALKGFITKDFDELRLPYARADSRFPRRTVYFGSVNPKNYLHDDTGNRRFWTIEAGDNFNYDHGVDMQQMWAQVKTWFMVGEHYHLSVEEHKELNAHNEDYESPDAIEEMIVKKYDFETLSTEKMTCSEILISLGFDKPDRKLMNQAGIALRKITGKDPIKNNGKKIYSMPIAKQGY